MRWQAQCSSGNRSRVGRSLDPVTLVDVSLTEEAFLNSVNGQDGGAVFPPEGLQARLGRHLTCCDGVLRGLES